jgi:hypothetical protein
VIRLVVAFRNFAKAPTNDPASPKLTKKPTTLELNEKFGVTVSSTKNLYLLRG